MFVFIVRNADSTGRLSSNVALMPSCHEKVVEEWLASSSTRQTMPEKEQL